MRAPLPRLQVEQVGPRRLRVTRLDEFQWRLWLLRLPVAFEFDGASVPKPARIVYDPLDLSIKGAGYHDMLYLCKGVPPESVLHEPEPGRVERVELVAPYRTFTRAEADQVLFDISYADGFPLDACYNEYRAVRLGGWVTWARRTPGFDFMQRAA